MRAHGRQTRGDLHTDIFIQHVLYRYVTDNDIDEHITGSVYGNQRNAMIRLIEDHFRPRWASRGPGGALLWMTLPHGVSSRPCLSGGWRTA
jgi:2-aminoadipate transaminase